MSDKSYSLFTGDVNGRLSETFTRIAELNNKHNFAFVIVAGNLFKDPSPSDEFEKGELEKLLQGGIDVPVTTYFSLGNQNLPAAVVQKLEADDGELCPNLFVLGRKTTVKTSDGFTIVAVGGKYAPGTDEPMDRYEATFNDVDVQTTGKDIDQADILITSDWPEGVQNGSRQLYKGHSPKGVQSVAELCARLKPRYHFSASTAFFEREPFFQPGDAPRHVTRFISLAPVGNADKHKAFGAYSLEPSQPPPQKVPEGCTGSPFVQDKKRKLGSQQDSYNNFRYANGNSAGHHERDSRRRKHPRKDTYVPPTPDECFFCLSNKKAEIHMATSVADNAYMTVAKGPLPTNATFPELGFPCHMLIIPVAHSPTIPAIPDKDEQKATLEEMEQYRTGLQGMVAAKSRGEGDVARLGAVTYEISRASGIHLQWQFIPMPVDLINRGIVEAGFEVEAENLSYPKFCTTAEEAANAQQGDYFKTVIWTETFQREMVLPLDSGFRFDLQFGRRVLAKLLGLDSRTDWRACKQEAAAEAADAEAFKKGVRTV